MSPCAASLREMTDVAIPYRFYPGQARWGAASVFQIDACEAGADPAEDFIADGVLPGGQVVRSDRGLALPAQQDRLVAWTDVREVRHVDHREVHADPPDDRHRPAADQHVPPVGQGAAAPVGIADRQERRGRGTERRMSRMSSPVSPRRLIPVSTLRWTGRGAERECMRRAAMKMASREGRTGIRFSSWRSGTSSGKMPPITRIGAVIPACRSSWPSATVATPSWCAPAVRSVRVTGTAPWPYALALTTAMMGTVPTRRAT